MAEAVKDLFPMMQFGIGPAIEDGFYYDFGVEKSFTPDDLVAIEERMRQIISEEKPFQRTEIDRLEAFDEFEQQELKRELISRAPRGRDHLDLPPGRLHRPVPRPARPRQRPHPRLQADEGRRRILARRLDPPHAAAHLRHRVVHRRRISTPTSRASKRPRSATTASSARSSTCSASTRSPVPACRSTTPRALASCA